MLNIAKMAGTKFGLINSNKFLLKNNGFCTSSGIYSSNGALSSIRILDLTRILAGPFATMILGDLGAEIIKIEKPGSGDDTRTWGPPFKGTESCYFLSINRNKKSVAIDFRKPQGVKIIKELVKKSDVLVENFMPGSLDRAGLGYETLSAIAPHLIYCSLTGYGSTGPYANRAGYDVIAASIGGLVGVTGSKDGEPCKVGVAVTDLMTGLYMQGAIMAALLYRLKNDNKGQKIDCNLLSTQVACMVNLASNYLNADLEGKRLGTEHESIVPYQAFVTKDGGYITIGAGNDRQFNDLCLKLNLKNLSDNKKYQTNKLRVKNRNELITCLQETFLTKSTKEWLLIFKGAQLPYGPINSLKEVFNDPQVLHNQMVKEYDHSTAGKIKLIEPPVTYSSMTNEVRNVPPILGEHTETVLTDLLGLSTKEILKLQSESIIQCC